MDFLDITINSFQFTFPTLVQLYQLGNLTLSVTNELTNQVTRCLTRSDPLPPHTFPDWSLLQSTSSEIIIW